MLALLGVHVHLEVANSAHHKVILNLVRRQVVEARPKGAQHNLTISLLLGKLSNVIAELDVKTILISAEDVCPDTKENISLFRFEVQGLHASLITLGTTLLLVLVLGNLFRRKLGVHIHELKDLGADLVEFSELDVAKDFDVVLAPLLLSQIVHRLSLT